MAILISDSRIEEQLLKRRRAQGADHHDESWEGVYFIPPVANDEHQDIVAELTAILTEVVRRPGLGKVRPGINLAGWQADWEDDYRCPDVAVFLNETSAECLGTHWRGGADFVVEVVSPGDRTREKIPFYAKIGVRELLIVNREPWLLELYRLHEDKLAKVGQSAPPDGELLVGEAVPLRFRLLPGEPRPTIEVTHRDGGRTWLI